MLISSSLKKIIGFCLMAIYCFALTPKQYLHNLIEKDHHKSNYCKTTTSKHFHKNTNHCLQNDWLLNTFGSMILPITIANTNCLLKISLPFFFETNYFYNFHLNSLNKGPPLIKV
ncbi:MAG: hypothetical protein QM539_00450 [Alphaproteobacteria bacterium]|nr:hypothetical protein [Alphaproteobacteria bacterium]